MQAQAVAKADGPASKGSSLASGFHVGHSNVDGRQYLLDRPLSTSPLFLAHHTEVSMRPLKLIRMAYGRAVSFSHASATPDAHMQQSSATGMHVDLSTGSEGSSSITSVDLCSHTPADMPQSAIFSSSIDASGSSTYDHVYVDSGRKTNKTRVKGKGKLTSIRDISWEFIEQQDVPAFCSAYDKWHMSGDEHVIMGSALSIHSIFGKKRKTTTSPATKSPSHTTNALGTDKETAIALNTGPHTFPMDPDEAYKPPRKSAKSAVAALQPNRRSERLREQENLRNIEELAAQAAYNQERMYAAVQELIDEQLAGQQLAEQQRLDDLRRREEENFAAATAFQQRWNEEDAETCRLAEVKARMKECTVCADEKDGEHFPASVTSKCQHSSEICSQCLDSWIVSALGENGIDGIKCPECPEKLEYQDVQQVASPATFHAYDKATITQALSSLPEFAWCLAPNCKSGQLNVDNSNYMDCASCGYKQCLQHKVAWHTGETCEQYEYRTSGEKAKEEEAQTLAMLDSMSKVCPGPGCGWRIQKSDGCDHVTCRKCRFEFCWQCLASHAEIKKVGNTAHKTGCKFHSNNLKLTWPFNAH